MQITKKLLLGLILLSLNINVSLASTITFSPTKGFHVNNFKEILGQENKEDELLRFAEKNGFNYLLLYNMYFINKHLYDLSNPEESIVLANFIKKAKTQYGIQEIGVVGEKAASFTWTQDYQKDYEYKKKFRIDVYHLEFEFWNTKLIQDYYCEAYLESADLDCTVAGAFEFYQQELDKMGLMTEKNNLRCETYIGNISTEQCAWIGQSCDRVLVHYYRKSDLYNNGNSIYQFKDYRVRSLTPPSGRISILPLFSAGNDFMGPWLADNPKEKAYITYLTGQDGYDEQKGDWKEHLLIDGYHWYRYTDLKANLKDISDLVFPNVLASTKVPSKGTKSQPFRTESGFSLIRTISVTAPRPSSSSSLAVNLYPNPVNHLVTLATEGEEITRVEVYQNNGTLYRVYEGQEIEAQQIDVSVWPEGQFVIRSYSNYDQQAKQLTVQHE